VIHVDEKGTAFKNGIRLDDIMLVVNMVQIKSLSQAKALLSQQRPCAVVLLRGLPLDDVQRVEPNTPNPQELLLEQEKKAIAEQRSVLLRHQQLLQEKERLLQSQQLRIEAESTVQQLKWFNSALSYIATGGSGPSPSTHPAQLTPSPQKGQKNAPGPKSTSARTLVM
jgi:hypothetical protein